MTSISAVLITLDEEERLPAALESVAFCDEVPVVDAGSRDLTRELAEARGARVLVSAPWPGWVAQRRLAVAAARHDWVLALDADERVTPALPSEVEALRARGLSGAGYLTGWTATTTTTASPTRSTSAQQAGIGAGTTTTTASPTTRATSAWARTSGPR